MSKEKRRAPRMSAANVLREFRREQNAVAVQLAGVQRTMFNLVNVADDLKKEVAELKRTNKKLHDDNHERLLENMRMRSEIRGASAWLWKTQNRLNTVRDILLTHVFPKKPKKKSP